MPPAQEQIEEYDLPAPKRRRRFLERTPVRRSLPWLVVIGMFVFWELFVWVFRIEPFVLPAPSAIFAALWQWRWLILDNSWQTLMTTLVGFGLAIVVGVLGGIALGSSVLVYESFYPALIGFNSVPKVAVIPILIIWFGIGTIPAIITAFLLAFFPILVNVATGSVGYLLIMSGNEVALRNTAVVGVLVHVALQCLLTPKLGLAGAALSTGISQAVMNLLAVLTIRARIGFWPVPLMPPLRSDLGSERVAP